MAINFSEVTSSAGVSYTGPSFGSSWGDFDNDTFPDLWVNNHALPDTFFLNQGNGTFANVSSSVFSPDISDTHGAAWADFDNDSDLDLVILLGGTQSGDGDANRLYVNTNGVLVDEAEARGVDNPISRGRTPVWFDYDNDGLLDLWSGNLARQDGLAKPTFFKQTSNNTFVDVRDETGIQVGQSDFAILADLTGDGKLDLLTRGFDASNSFALLTIYDMAAVPFTNVVNTLLPSGLDAKDITAADFNNDGRIDLFLAGDIVTGGDKLLINTGSAFIDVTATSGISNGFGDSVSIVAGDFDNDMDVDIYVLKGGPQSNLPNVLYENQGNGVFVPVLNAGGAAGTSVGSPDTVTMADYDRDGFLDLFITNGEGTSQPRGPSQLFRNAGNQNNWLEISLEGTVSNRDGLGAQVFVTSGGVTQIREQAGGVHRFSQNSTVLHFGLGSNTVIDQVVVKWPSGIEQILSNVSVNQFLQIQETEQNLNRVSLATTNNAIEPNTDGMFTVSLSEVASSDTVITYSVSGTATAGSDYVPLQGTVTIPAGSLSASIDVEVLDDTVAEANETVFVTLLSITSGDSDVVIGATKTATVTIGDNDQPPSAFTVQAESISNLTGYRIENNANASGGSMLSLAGGSSGETGTATFTFNGVSGIYNAILGAFDENDGVATLQLAQNGALIGSVLLDQNLGSGNVTTATKVERTVANGVTLTNGDSLRVTGIENGGEHARFDFIRFEPVSVPSNTVTIATSQNAAEPGNNGLFTVSLAQTSTSDTVVSYSVTGTATAGTDYGTLSGTVTILSGQLSATIPVTVLDDQFVEGNESVMVTLTAVTGAAGVILGSATTAMVTIEDNDQPATSLTIEAESITNVTGYRIENNANASGGSMLSLAGVSSGETGTATFSFNGSSGTYNIILGAFDENDGSATLQLSQNGALIGNVLLNQNLGSGNATAATKVERTVASGVMLTNGDSLTVTGMENAGEHARFDFIRFEPVSTPSNTVTIATTQNAAEPSSNGVFIVSLAQVSTTDTFVSYTVGGTATPGTDYTEQHQFCQCPACCGGSSNILAIPAGTLSVPLTIAVLDDQLAEGDETVIITLDQVMGSTNVTLGATTTATITIADDDLPPPTSFTVEAESIANVTGYRIENNVNASSGSMLSLSGSAQNEIGTASFAFTGITGAYNIFLGAFDENDGVATLQVSKGSSIIGSVILDQQLGGNGASAATKVERLVTTAGATTLANGDIITVTGFENAGEHARFDFLRFEAVGPTVPTVSIAASQNGAEPDTNGEFTLSLNEALATDTVVNYSVGGSATAGSDYTALSGSVTILAGQTTATIPVTVLDDALVEGNETVSITLTGVSGGVALGATEASVVIADNDQPLVPITFEAENPDLFTNYRVENLAAASGGQVLSFVGGAPAEMGSATFEFGPDNLVGTYDIILGTFDENDGVASFTVELNDFEAGTTTQIGSIDLDANLGSGVANFLTKVSVTVATGISLTTGDSLTVTGFEQGGEHARLDFLQLVPSV